MKKILILTCLLSVVFVANAFANGLSLNSIGPKALGMGGAFVGLADDGTAIYWNPAGLVGQESGVIAAVTDIIPFASYKWEYADFGIDIDAEAKVKHYVGPNIFVNYTLDKWAFGFGAYVPAGVGAEWDKDDFGGNMKSKIGVIDFSPAVAYKLSEQFSIGVAANIYYGMFEMDKYIGMDTSQELSGLGYGAALGLKLKANEKLSFGLSYKTPVKIAFEGDGEMISEGVTTDWDNIEADVEWPTWFGFGSAYKFKDNWTITFDVQYSNWGALEEVVEEIEFIHPLYSQMTMKDTLHMEWEDAVQIRLGTEYNVNESFSILGGYYYDPAPAPDKTNNVLFPSSTNHVITTGCVYSKNKIAIKLGIEYLLGAERDISDDLTLEGFKNEQPGKHKMDIFAFSLGLGYDF